jgi:uncharacterized membrane protein YhaH (DUF805 family)
MNFQEAIQSGFRNYVTFEGRACRSEFWYWQLFLLAGGLVAEFFDFGTGLYGSPFSTLFWLGTLIPTLAVGIRRLHDAKRSGWWLLLFFVPLIGAIVLIVWWCTKGTRGYNGFGADPLPAEISRHGRGRSLHRAQTNRAG